jgi:hypothetical protein
MKLKSKFELEGLVRAFDTTGLNRMLSHEELNKSGKLLWEENNLIVLRGRAFAVERLLNTSLVVSPEDLPNLNQETLDFINVEAGFVSNAAGRSVCMFSIGNGGADPNQPFNPYIPEFNNLTLSHRIPFITVDPNKYSSTDPAVLENPSVVTALTPDQLTKYKIPVESPNPTIAGATIIQYYGKTFEQIDWSIDALNNEVFARISLMIDRIDARGELFNELGLLIADTSFGSVELASRICFDTESLINPSKQIQYEYLIYA